MRKPRIAADKCETALDRAVCRWANATGQDYEEGAKGALNDLFYGGCQSGMVSGLIYYTDTLKFYKRHQQDIAALVKEMQDQTGEPISKLLRDFDHDDPLCLEQSNQNLLAWFGFEESARVLASRMDWEV